MQYITRCHKKKSSQSNLKNSNLNIQGIFEMPDCLWPVVIFTSLSLAFISVLFGIRGVLKNNLASFLRSGD